MPFARHAQITVAKEQARGEIRQGDLARAEAEIHLAAREQVGQRPDARPRRHQHSVPRRDLPHRRNKRANDGMLQVIATADADRRLRRGQVERLRRNQ
jgi:hypothetical protein